MSNAWSGVASRCWTSRPWRCQRSARASCSAWDQTASASSCSNTCADGASKSHYAPVQTTSQVVWAIDGLAPGVNHSIQIVARGTKNASASGAKVDYDAILALKQDRKAKTLVALEERRFGELLQIRGGERAATVLDIVNHGDHALEQWHGEAKAARIVDDRAEV